MEAIRVYQRYEGSRQRKEEKRRKKVRREGDGRRKKDGKKREKNAKKARKNVQHYWFLGHSPVFDILKNTKGGRTPTASRQASRHEIKDAVLLH
jgi:hypothetical protein